MSSGFDSLLSSFRRIARAIRPTRCRICGRVLNHPKSIARRMGLGCAKKHHGMLVHEALEAQGQLRLPLFPKENPQVEMTQGLFDSTEM